jgi:hypothetical protein
MFMSQCKCCADFEKTCKVVLNAPNGLVVLINEDCDEMKYFAHLEHTRLTQKASKLREGGDLRGTTHLQPA